MPKTENKGTYVAAAEIKFQFFALLETKEHDKM